MGKTRKLKAREKLAGREKGKRKAALPLPSFLLFFFFSRSLFLNSAEQARRTHTACPRSGRFRLRVNCYHAWRFMTSCEVYVTLPHPLPSPLPSPSSRAVFTLLSFCSPCEIKIAASQTLRLTSEITWKS